LFENPSIEESLFIFFLSFFSLQDLKERYYKITKKLMESKHGPIDPEDPNSKAFQDELTKYDYDKGFFYQKF
jgi:hypothetical protein